MFNIQNFRILSSIFILIFFVFGLPFISSIALSHENNHLGSTSEFPSYSKLVKKASPAVVNIFTRKAVKKQIPPLFKDPFFQRFFGDRFPRLERERIERSLGSGVIVRPDGLIVTNYHVISGADEIKVVLSDRREFQARVIREDQRSDLAILRIETNDQLFPFIELGDSDELEVGDFVIAIGNPFGVGQTVTSGIISGLNMSLPFSQVPIILSRHINSP